MKPIIHLEDENTAYGAACNTYLPVATTDDPGQVTCGNCQRTKLFKHESDRRFGQPHHGHDS